MKYYIIMQEGKQAQKELGIVKVKEEEISQFEKNNANKIVLKADSLMDVILAFEEMLERNEQKL